MAEKYNKQFHKGPCEHLCPICKKRKSWLHIPHLNGITFDNYTGRIQDCCWKCFHDIWRGET